MVTQTNQLTRTNRLKCVALALGGCFITMVECCVILYVYAFASMISPEIVGWDRWAAILRKMVFTPSVVVVIFGMLAVGAGITIFVISAGMALGKNVPNPRNIILVAACEIFILFMTFLFVISM